MGLRDFSQGSPDRHGLACSFLKPHWVLLTSGWQHTLSKASTNSPPHMPVHPTSPIPHCLSSPQWKPSDTLGLSMLPSPLAHCLRLYIYSICGFPLPSFLPSGNQIGPHHPTHLGNRFFALSSFQLVASQCHVPCPCLLNLESLGMPHLCSRTVCLCLASPTSHHCPTNLFHSIPTHSHSIPTFVSFSFRPLFPPQFPSQPAAVQMAADSTSIITPP